MSKQINQYTKTRTSGTFKDDDYMDFDSTEDSGSTFESAKGKILEFVTYLKTKIPTLYSGDGTLAGNRTVTMSGLWARFKGGDVINEMSNEVDDFGFIVQAVGQVEKGRLGYDQTNTSAILELQNALITYFKANNGNISMGGDIDVNYILNLIVEQGSSKKPFSIHAESGGASNGDNYSIDFFYDDSLGAKTLGGSIATRVNGVPTVGNVMMDMVMNGDLKVQNNNRVLITPTSLTKAAIAQFEVRGKAGVTSNTTAFFKGNGNTGSQIVLWVQNLAGSSLFYVDGLGKFHFNLSNLSTADFQMKSANLDNAFYLDSSADAVGMGTSTPSNKSVLDLQSTTKGFLPPRMTTTQRDAITSVPTGLNIYNTTTNKMNFYNGSAWEVVTSA